MKRPASRVRRPAFSVPRPASHGSPLVCALLLIAAGILLLLPGELLAQGCAMCATYSGGTEDPIAKGMNASVLFLVSMPFLVVGSIATFFFYMHRRAQRARRLFHVLTVQKEGIP